MVAWDWVGGLNTPVGITCHTRASLCYPYFITLGGL